MDIYFVERETHTHCIEICALNRIQNEIETKIGFEIENEDEKGKREKKKNDTNKHIEGDTSMCSRSYTQPNKQTANIEASKTIQKNVNQINKSFA